MSEIKFPKNFLWGAGTSSHQVEGGNVNDWSKWEKGNAEGLAKKSETYWQPWQKKIPRNATIKKLYFWAGL